MHAFKSVRVRGAVRKGGGGGGGKEDQGLTIWWIVRTLLTCF